MRKSILLNLEVSMFGGGWKSAIDEAYELAKELNIGCVLNYVDQYHFVILPTHSQQEINELKNTRVVIGL